MKIILKARDIMDKMVLGITVLLLAGIAIFIGLQIFFRTIGIGIDWTEEFARFSFIGVTFLGSAVAITRNRHIVIDFLVVRLPDIVRRFLLVTIHLAISAFMIVCMHGLTILMRAAQGVSSNSVMWFQLNYMHGVVFVGCVLMCLSAFIRAIEYAILKKELPAAQGE